jgi:hypothetical protein
VVASIALGRVLSPQFTLWLLPFPLLVRGRRGVLAAALVVLTLALTQAEFPTRYWDYALRFAELPSALVLTRDLSLLALLVLLLWPRQPAPA